MRIVLVNWAKIWDGAVNGGGVNGYCQALAIELLKLGHEVVSLVSGTSFVPLQVLGEHTGPAEPGPCTIRRHPDWLGVKVFEVINSPVVAPSAQQFAGPDAERSAPELETLIENFLRDLRPDLVHFHNIEGFSAGCVHAAKRAGARTIYSLHNYHTICPQTYLMRGHRSPCFDHQNGHACVGCMEAPDPAAVRRASAGQYAGQYAATMLQGHAAPPQPQHFQSAPVSRTPTWAKLGEEFVNLLQGEPPAPPSPAAPKPFAVPLPGAAVADVNRPWSMDDDHRGITDYFTGKTGIPAIPGPDHPEWIPLANDVPPEPTHATPPNAYGQRRLSMVEMLNSCDRVLAVSDFVRRRFVAAGVREDRISTMHIGTMMNTIVKRHADLLWDPPAFDPARPRPITLVFIGFNSFYKGLHMFADALELLTPEYLQHLHIFLYATGHNFDWRFRRFEHRLAGLTTHPGYGAWDVPWIMGGKDLAIVPSVWWDNAPQTVFEALACGVPVLGANLGGIPDFVKDGHNGLLFRGNNRFDLARVLAGVIRNPRQLETLRRNVRPPKDIADHAGELSRLYQECVSSPPG